MFHVHESEKEYRFGDSGPKYLMRGPRAGFGEVVLKPGQDFANHFHHVMEENFFVTEGELEFIIDGQSYIGKKGDLFHVEPEESHYLRNNGDVVAKAYFFLAPFQDGDKEEKAL